MQCYYNYLVIALNILWADRNGVFDHNWDQRWRNIWLANTANHRNIPLSVFLFRSFPSKKTYLFTNYYHREFLLQVVNKVAENLLHRGTGWKFRCNFATKFCHFSTSSAFLQLVCQFFSVLIIGHFRKQVSGPSYSKAGYLNVPNQPLNH